MHEPERKERTQRKLRSLLRFRVWLSEVIQPTELQVTLFWAGIIGLLAALGSLAFRALVELAHLGFTGHRGSYAESFTLLPAPARFAIPVLGGLLAGLTLMFATRLRRKTISTDYMEAIVIGNGHVPARLSLIKCLSALFSIASGASIGREGPLVQLSAMTASGIGRARKIPTLQLRVLVACGAAAGIASAYNAPIGGALFVAEIVLQSLAMETFGPLVFASVVATLTTRQLLGEHSLYELPTVRLSSNWEILPQILLGLIAGLIAPWFLRLLRGSERLFTRLTLPIYARLTLGGCIVGGLAIFFPDVCGNGSNALARVLHGQLIFESVLILLVVKVLATAATFGSGAVGGVFTPTLFTGACIGAIVGHAVQAVWPGPPIMPQSFTLVGMGAFLAATTHAPVMAILMLFELTLDYQIILPLMLACVIGHYTCLAFEKRSIYSASLKRKGAATYRRQLSDLHVTDLMKSDPPSVQETAGFRIIAENFVAHPFSNLFITDAQGFFRGVISLHDIKGYLHEADLGHLVIARDLLRDNFPTIAPDVPLTEALDRFSGHSGERLPVTVGGPAGRLVGSISKTDLILALAERSKEGAD